MCINVLGQLTVYFECPFWVGIFEVMYLGKLQTCKVVFGSEPKDYEIYEFILVNYNNLKFSKPMDSENKKAKSKVVNPKRLQREINKMTNERGISTKAQEAMRLERESRKTEHKKETKLKKEEEQKLQFERKQLKKKEKKRGH